MALFKVNRGNRATLPQTKNDGYAYFCTDTGEFYIDYKVGNTVQRRLITSGGAIETNKGLEQKFWRGTQAEYDAIATKDESTMYIILDGEGGNTTGGGGSDLPSVTTADNGKFLRVVNGTWTASVVSIDEAGTNFTYGTEDLIEGESYLAPGTLYFVVE